jgi:integrase
MARRGPRRRSLTVEAFLIDKWLPVARGTVRPTTFMSYESHVRGHIAPRLGRLRLQRLSPEDLNEFYAGLQRSGRRKGSGPLHSSSVRRIHATLHRALGDAVRWELLDRNPADRSSPPKQRAETKVEMRTWTADELRHFLEFVKSESLYTLWLLLATTGMRRGEAAGLRWSDVDLEGRSLSVRQTVVLLGHKPYVSAPKSARSRRVIALDERTATVLAEYRAQASASEADFVFSDSDGSFIHPAKVTRMFDRHVRASGLRCIRLHDLRHTHATLALQAGVHPKVVSERLGHSTVSLTLDVYSHALQHIQKEATQRFAALLFDSDD